MHEISLVRALLQQAVQVAADNGGGVILHVRVQVGPLSGVEPVLLVSAFEDLRRGTALSRSTLEAVQVTLEARCRTCGAAFEPVRFRFRCSACGGSDTEVTQGDGVVLESITLDEQRQRAAI